MVNHEDKITDRSAFNFFGATIPKRDCTHDGQRIHEMTIEQVEQVRCGGEPIPTLAEVIDLFRGSGVAEHRDQVVGRSEGTGEPPGRRPRTSS